jgi:inner membrane protein
MSGIPDLPPLPPRTGSSALLKILAIGILGFCLLIPLALIWTLIEDRSTRRDQVVAETTASVGAPQAIGGIVLDVPYDVPERSQNGVVTLVTRHAYILPEQLSIEAALAPEVRRRSQYSAIVYRTTVRMQGTLGAPDVLKLAPDAAAVHWDRAAITVEITDLRGTLAVSPFRWGDREVALEPMNETGVFAHGVRGLAPLTPDATGPQRFAVDLTLAGSQSLRFVPSGKATEVSLSSPWPDPGFTGAFLPATRSVSPSGFSATWQVSYLARSFAHTWLSTAASLDALERQRAASSFGVNLVQTVDEYQQTERAVKYGLLFVLLTFTVFLLWELLKNLRLHPVQYVLIGCALVVFYLLLLSLAEQMAFGLAYLIAAGATVTLVAAYAASVLRAGLRGALGIGGWLSGLYGVLYVLLRLEDLALLVGSVFVFLVLAAVMYLTRRFDWNDMRVPA